MPRKIFGLIVGLCVIGAQATGNAEAASYLQRRLYAVNEAPSNRGAISVYEIDAGHRLIKTIQTVPNVADVKGVAASGVTGKLYVTYIDDAGTGKIYCLDLNNDKVLWNRVVRPGVDRLAINPDGRYSPCRLGKAAK